MSNFTNVIKNCYIYGEIYKVASFKMWKLKYEKQYI